MLRSVVSKFCGALFKSMVKSPFWTGDNYPADQEIPPPFMGPESSLLCSHVCLWTPSEASWILSTPSHLASILILLYHACYICCPPHAPWPHWPQKVKWRSLIIVNSSLCFFSHPIGTWSPVFLTSSWQSFLNTRTRSSTNIHCHL